jgi:hypothetical protein
MPRAGSTTASFEGDIVRISTQTEEPQDELLHREELLWGAGAAGVAALGATAGVITAIIQNHLKRKSTTRDPCTTSYKAAVGHEGDSPVDDRRVQDRRPHVQFWHKDNSAHIAFLAKRREEFTTTSGYALTSSGIIAIKQRAQATISTSLPLIGRTHDGDSSGDVSMEMYCVGCVLCCCLAACIYIFFCNRRRRVFEEIGLEEDAEDFVESDVEAAD